jgi:hypothetical protein
LSRTPLMTLTSKRPIPVGIRNLDEELRLKDPDVVDEHIYYGQLRDDSFLSCSVGEIRHYAINPSISIMCPYRCYRQIYARLRTSVHINMDNRK